jgi:hypothetical protein
MKFPVISLFAGIVMFLTSCAVPHGWKATHEDIAVRRDSTGAVIEKIDCETHLTHQFYVVSPEGVAADKWCEHERYFYLVQSDNSRVRLSCIPDYSNPRFFPLPNSQWLVIWPNEGYVPAYSENLAVALLDTKDAHQNGLVRGRYYLAKGSPSGNVLTPTARPLPENLQVSDLNYKVDFVNGNAILKTYNGDFVFNFSDGTLRPL